MITIAGRLKKYWVFGLVFLYLAFRIPGLGTDILNSDGARWYQRSERFLTAIKDRNFAATYQHYQPGVTLMWINSITRKVIWEAQDFYKLPRWSLENSEDFPKIHAVSKTILVTVLSLVFLYQLILISKITNTKTALIYGIFVATEPYLIGIDRWFHLTSLESYLAFSAYLTYISVLGQRTIGRYALTGILIGLAVLSKLTAAAVLPLILFVEVIQAKRIGNYRRSIRVICIVVTAFIVTVFATFPAMWVDSADVMQKLANALVSAVGNDERAVYFKPPFSYVYYLVVLAYKLSPITVTAFAASLLIFIRRLKRKESSQSTMILAYFLTFFLVLTLSSKKIDRYVLSLFQPLILFVSLYATYLNRKLLTIAIISQVIFSAYAVYKIAPALSGYYSPVLGQATTALHLGIYENSGEYFSQAAFYLNTRGRGDVFVPDNYDSFKYFYKGNSLREYFPSAEYVVTSVDFDRKDPRIIGNCNKLETSFGTRYSSPAVYVFKCPAFPRP